MFDIFELQKKLVELALPSGFEKNVGEYLASLAKPYVDEVYTDTLGNVICHKKGNGKKILFTAHMDVIGFMAGYIDDKGYVRVMKIGGHSDTNLPNTPVRFESGACGSVHQDSKGDLYIDIGATSPEEAMEMVQPGDVAVFDTPVFKMGENTICTPYADDLICCITLLLCLEQLKDSENDLYFCFSVQEEVGCRGASVLGYNIRPDLCIAVDIGSCFDEPGDKVRTIRLGGGPSVGLKDNNLYDLIAIREVEAAAQRIGAKVQHEISSGGTDAGVIQRAPGGVSSMAFSVPLRGIHTPCEIYNTEDVKVLAEVLADLAVNSK